MKKLVLLCLAMTLSFAIYAQDTKVDKAKKEVKKTTKKVTEKTEKAAKKTGKAIEKTTDKAVAKTKKTVSKSEAKAEKTVVKTETKAKKTTAKIKGTSGSELAKQTNEKAPRKPDKVTGTYNGKKVYTGPRGGRYYINKNGNKTYIQD